MFALRKRLLPAVLLLALLLAGSTPAVSREGVWVYPTKDGWFSISLVNLTDYPLLITQNSSTLWGNSGTDKGWNSVPFYGNGQLNLAPYRTATWRSSDPGGNLASRGQFAWSGSFSLLPKGMDPKWTVSVCMHTESASGAFFGKGTWVHLAVSDLYNDEWGSPYNIFFSPPGNELGPGWRHGVWGTPVPSLSRSISGLYSVMTASGTRLTVSLFSADTANLTLVIRQTNWDGSKTDDYTGWQLDFEDDDTDSMP